MYIYIYAGKNKLFSQLASVVAVLKGNVEFITDDWR